MRKTLLLGLASWLSLAATAAQAQANLGTSPYVETFDNLANGLPTGFSVYTGATATSLGTPPTAAQLILTPGTTTAWTNTTGGFKNFASADALPAGATTAQQTAATDRALGVRQTGSFGDATPPGAAFVFQAANTTGKTDFTLTFKLQSLDATVTREATWQVDYGTGSTPSTFTKVGSVATTGKSTFANNTVTVSFGTALDDQAGPVYIRIATLANTTGSGNRPSSAIDDFQLSWNTPNASTPVLTASATTLAFGSQNINTNSASQQYTLLGANLSTATTVTATGPFTVSKNNSVFSSSITYTPAELAMATPVYVRFTPTTTGPATGSISNVSAGATPRTVTLTGTGSNPNQTLFDFSTCVSTLSDGWSQYSVTGPQVWGCTTFGRDPNAPTGTAAAPYGVQINGYSSGNVPNEDWFISPAVDLTSYAYPLFSFWSRTAFTGPSLKLRVSTNYSGTGSPSAATWTDLNVLFPSAGSDTWTQTANINLAAFKSQKVYVAFVYTSTTAGAARWTLDDIAFTNSPTPPTPTILTDVKNLAFGYTATGTNGDRTLNISGNDLTGPVTVTSSDPLFTLSKDGVNFSTSLTLTAAEANATTKAVTVRFRPTTASASFTGKLTVSTPGAATPLTVTLSADTYDTNKTLEVVNWNIEWFGSTVSGLGPDNKELQQTNVSKVVNYLNADIYALAEVVDTVRLANVVSQLSAATGHPYAFQVSRFGSYADNPQDPDYANDQKLSFVYRTDVLSNVSTGIGLLRCSEQDACPAYNAWASGRFPYLMSADVTLDGTTKRVNFIVIHAKANATATSANDYARRKQGATLLKNLLDTQYPNQNTLIVGDYNDVLEGTIATGVTPPVSSYDVLVSDSTKYVSLTLPLARAGAQSTASYATVIDNVIATKALANYYIKGTAAIRTDAAAMITNYANTTSDHYPVFTRYSFSSTAAACVNDTQAPTILAAGFTVSLVNGQAKIEAADIDYGSTDDCAVASMTIDKSTFTCANIGDNAVTLTVTDRSGNVSKQTVTVVVVGDGTCNPACVNDTQAPTVLAAGFVVPLVNGQAKIEAADIDYGSSDNCAVASMTIDKSTFTCANVGNNAVTLTVTDRSGNVSKQTVTVVVVGDGTCTTPAGTQLAAYPNPVVDKVNLGVSDLSANAVLSVYNSQGVRVLTQAVSNSAQEVNLGALPTGVYMLQVNDGGKVLSQRVTKN
jgi:hypothetical protein